MAGIRRWWIGIAVFSCLSAAFLTRPAFTQDAEEPEEEAIPLILINLASVDRTLTDTAWMFNSINRSDMLDVIGSYLTMANDLKGVDRTRPFGYALFLETDALPPRPQVVAYVPIDNLNDLLTTIAKAPVTPHPVADRPNTFELMTSDDNTIMTVRVIGNYAFAASNDGTESVLDRLPDIHKLTEALASRYDLSVTAQVKAVPEGVRQVFVNFLRTQAEIDLQRRDEEEEAVYLVRRANGLNAVELIEDVVLLGEDLTLGWNAEPELHRGTLEGTLNVTPDSPFAKFLSEVGGKSSLFAPLRNEDRPFTLIVSWLMNKREKTAISGLLKAVRVKLSEQLPQMALPGGPIESMNDSLQATIDNGHLDMFLQFDAVDVQEFVFLGGLRLAGAESFGAALEQFLQGLIVRIQETTQENAGLVNELPQIIPNAESHQGVAFHKVVPQRVREEDERLYGGVPDLFVGVSSRAFWFSIGRKEALSTLTASIDRVLTAPAAERNEANNVPLSVTIRVAPWLELPDPVEQAVPEKETAVENGKTATADEDAKAQRRRANRARREAENRELAKQVFTPTDGIRIEGRPLESGFRLRIQLDEGFVKMLGSIIAREYDRSQL